MRTITIQTPEVAGQEVHFAWEVEPRSDLYARQSFYLRFGPEVAVRDVPADLWWIVALLCLHPHWPLLRPCRVELPVELPPGEREFWLRLHDAGVGNLELNFRDSARRERTVEIVDHGRRLQPAPAPARSGVATAFSGGKDGLVQLGLLLELGERPLAVTTTSPMPYLADHASPRRRTAIETVAARDDVEHAEVRSNYRECWDNSFAHTVGYDVSVNELSDTFLYLSAMLIVAWATGRDQLLLAAEAEIQTGGMREGVLVLNRHFMYSSVTQRSLDRLLARRGLGHGSLLYPLRLWQIRRLLWTRYPQLRTLQYSCWRHQPGESACSGCTDCLGIALSALEAGVAPSKTGVDLRRLLERLGKWESALEPNQARYSARPEVHRSSLRQLEAMRTRAFAAHLARAEPRQLLRRDGLRTLRRYASMRARLLPEARAVPRPDYVHDYLPLLDERWRGPLERIFDSQFERAAPGACPAPVLELERAIARIVEPLSGVGEPVRTSARRTRAN